MQKTDEPEVLTASEAAKFLRVSRPTLNRMIKEKSIPHKKISRKILFLKSAILDWLTQD